MGRLRWMCCRCGNSWMVVKGGDEQNICSYSECRHERCNNCTTVMMDVPKGPLGMTPICSPVPDQIYLPHHLHHPHQNNDEEEEDERPSIRLPVLPLSPARADDDAAEATISHEPRLAFGDHVPQARS